jgi:hypothetical protein
MMMSVLTLEIVAADASWALSIHQSVLASLQ